MAKTSPPTLTKASRCPPRSEARSQKPPTRWTTRLMPFFLLGVIGFACWALTGPICINFFFARHENGAAIVFLVLHYIFLILMISSYGRTLYVVNFIPGLVPLEPKLSLEAFYTRDVFTCRSDGLPIWCSDCQNWKPERAHHSGEIQRCVKKMDHYCPWAGGMIGETSFKFFIQFVSYTSMYCAVCLSAGAYVTSRLAREGNGTNAAAIVLIAVAAFFGLFSFTMASLSLRFCFINSTNIESLRGSDKVYQLAVRIPLNQTPNSENTSTAAVDYETITFPRPDLNGDPNAQQGRNRPAAEHKFAIVKTEMGENPWDTGSYYTNFKSVMGDRGLLDWLLPLRPAVDRLRERLKK
ncbi:Palmitoyltransferase pfa5 [Gnomoniopsis sp. IMI 355080]|nr:Palmitoyltransferase pfa5 [Gnomoniopsis sp. IMI 355080]